MAFVYATTGTGPSAGGIGWFDFGPSFTLTPGQAAVPLTGTLRNGITVSFSIGLSLSGGTATNVTAVTAPSSASSYFGAESGGYTGLTTSNVVLRTALSTANTTERISLTNIVVTDANGNTLPNFTFVMADAESTSGTASVFESIILRSNGGNIQQLAQLGSTNIPTLSTNGGVASISGYLPSPSAGYVLSTASPTTATIDLQVPAAGLQQGIAIGFAVTQLELYQKVNGRLSSADQFTLNIEGTPSAHKTTTGTASGLQTVFSTLSAIPGNTYTISEVMAAGSGSALSAYTQGVTAVNLTPGGTVPTIGALPQSITPALGDIIQYTITSTTKPVVSKSVSPSYAQPGDLLKYTVSVFNPNATAPLTGTVVTDAVPPGTTYVGNLTVSVPFTGTTPATGITLTSIPALGTATMSWFVQTANTLPATNPISNTATVTPSGGGPITTNAVTTQVNKANLTASGNFTKTAAPPYTAPGDTITYTLSIKNTGNVPANNIVITDPIPSGATYVTGSVTGTIPFTGTPDAGLVLLGSILAGATATFTFQVVLSGNIPAVNPIPNTASVAYTFTVDPAVPDGVTGFGQSNNAPVTVSTVVLTMNKTANKFVAYLNDVIIYSLAVTNSGNVPANNVVITDTLPYGLTYGSGSLTATVPVSGDPNTAITLASPIAPGQTVTLTFQATVTALPNPNPIENVATAVYTYTINPATPNGASGTSISNGADTTVFMNNYSQQISDLINSVALEEAAMGAIANAEGAKIQRFAAIPGVTPKTLLCVNKSITDVMNSMTTLESILLQKLSSGNGQITGGTNC